MRKILVQFVALATLMLPTAWAATPFPQRPVRLVVPVPPGGASDFTARLIGQKMADTFGQNVVVENRGGAAGIIATEIVAHANADGYTLLVSSNTTHGIGPVLYRKLPYNAMSDFTHIALINSIPTVMVVHQSVPAASVKEFVALARAKPKSLSFGSAGGGSTSRLMGELFMTVTGAPLTHVPYKGSGLAAVDLAAGQVQVMFDGLPSIVAHVKTGKLRPLAILDPKRSSVLPDTVTMAEAGYPGIEGALWYGLSGPAGLPGNVVDKIASEVFRIVALDEIKERFASMGAIASPLGSSEYAAYIRAENAKWSPVVRASGAAVD
jgi:tripartite-type tricarboxylate transporter receptor subunit TctC